MMTKTVPARVDGEYQIEIKQELAQEPGKNWNAR
jgi:hypothetical protein